MDLLYAVAIALPLGWFLGRIVGRVYLDFSGRGAVTKKRTPFLPLALLLAVYGLTEAAGGYGFLAAFTTGLGFRRAMSDHAGELERFADFGIGRMLFTIVVGTVLLSVVLHGLSVRPFLERWEGEREVEL